MSPDTRSVVAAIAWTAFHGRACAWVYDYDRAMHREISASIIEGKAGAYDHARRAVVEGMLGATVLDHASQTHITLERTPHGLKGYDHGAKAFYEATVQDDRVSLYDYADAAHHAYAVS